jgi:hypothetical protein
LTFILLLPQDTDEERDEDYDRFASSGVQFRPDGSAWPVPQ